MAKKIIILVFASLFVIWNAQGQTIYDALRMSTLQYGSTARAAGVGGGFSGLGADISVVSSNPAGLAEFRKSEFVFGINVLNGNADATLAGETENKTSSIFDIQTLGFISQNSPIASNWVTSNFAISFNRVANFGSEFSYTGNTNGSITERFQEQAEGFDINQLYEFEDGIAWEVGAIFGPDAYLTYGTDFDGIDAPVRKSQDVNSTGGMNELALSYAGNFKNKFSIGATVGFPLVSFTENKSYRESDPDDNFPFFNELRFNEYLETSGLGFNVKLGLLYKLSRSIRIGAAIHSPSWLFLTDDFTTDIEYTYIEAGSPVAAFEESAFPGNFRYRISTSMRAILSGSYLINTGGLKGFITGEVEFTDYGGSAFNLTADSNLPGDLLFEEELNREIENTFQPGVTLRVGSELVFNKLRVRGGVGLIGTPYQDASAGSISNSLHLGAGWRGDRIYIDIAGVRQDLSRPYTPFLLSNISREQNVRVDNENLLLVVTVGFKI